MLPLSALSLLHQLRLRGTLTAAAEALHLSRSAASHQLAGLQRRLGVRLTERVGRRMRLTEAGRDLALQAERVLTEIEHASAVVERARRILSGTVTIAAVQTIAVNLLPTVLTTLRDRHPGLRVECHSIDTEESLLAVPSGEIDVAVVPVYDTMPLRVPDGVRVTTLFTDPVRLALPAGHRLATSPGPVSMTELADEQWVTGEPDSYFGRLVPTLCLAAGFTPDIVHRSSDYLVIGSLVAAGHGVTVLPQSARLADWSRLAVRSIAGRHTERDIVALTRHGSTGRPTVEAVVAELRDCGEGRLSAHDGRTPSS